MERNQFTFYASFARAIRRIKDPADRVLAYDAIVAYALNGVAPDLDTLPDSVAVALEVAAPVLDSSRKKAKAGKASGNKRRANANKAGTETNTSVTESEKPQTRGNRKQEQEQVQDQVQEEDKVQDKDKDKEQMFISTPSPDGDGVDKTPPPSPGTGSGAVDAYMQRISPTPSAASMLELLAFEREMDTGCCLRAIDAALDANARNWNYVKTVLETKKAQGIRTAADWDRMEEDRMDRKSRRVSVQSRNEPEAPEYDTSDLDRLWEEMQGSGAAL